MSGVVSAIGAVGVIGSGVIASNAASKAEKAAGSAADKASAAVKAASDEARGDLFALFPSAQQVAQQGFQGALDTFNQSIPQQQQAFTQGNIGAQQAILSGLPQIQNALLGGNVDLSQLQPFQQQQAQLQQPLQQTVVGPDAQQQQGGGLFGAQLGQGTSLADLLGGRTEQKEAETAQQLAIQQAADREFAGNQDVLKLQSQIASFNPQGGATSATAQMLEMQERLKALKAQSLQNAQASLVAQQGLQVAGNGIAPPVGQGFIPQNLLTGAF